MICCEFKILSKFFNEKALKYYFEGFLFLDFSFFAYIPKEDI